MNVAYNVDCMEYMRTLPDKAFDLKDYFDAQEKRFEEHAAQGNLFLNTRAAVEVYDADRPD